MSRNHIAAKDRGPRRDPPDRARCPLCGHMAPAVHRRGKPIFRCSNCDGLEFGAVVQTARSQES